MPVTSTGSLTQRLFDAILMTWVPSWALYHCFVSDSMVPPVQPPVVSKDGFLSRFTFSTPPPIAFASSVAGGCQTSALSLTSASIGSSTMSHGLPVDKALP